ncbi:MAG: hypothetical protein R3C15_20855 [Thermoleophilia bacterium]
MEQQLQTSIERVAVTGRPGIWCRSAKDGRVRFEVGYVDDEGRQRWLTVAGGLQSAEAALVSLERRAGARAAQGTLTFGDIAEAWLEDADLTPRMREAYEWALHVHLLPRIGQLRIGEVSEWHAIELLDALRDAGYANWTLQAVLAPLSAVVKHAVAQGLLLENPFGTALDGTEPTDQAGPVTTVVDGCQVVDIRRLRAALARG